MVKNDTNIARIIGCLFLFASHIICAGDKIKVTNQRYDEIAVALVYTKNGHTEVVQDKNAKLFKKIVGKNNTDGHYTSVEFKRLPYDARYDRDLIVGSARANNKFFRALDGQEPINESFVAFLNVGTTQNVNNVVVDYDKKPYGVYKNN